MIEDVIELLERLAAAWLILWPVLATINKRVKRVRSWFKKLRIPYILAGLIIIVILALIYGDLL